MSNLERPAGVEGEEWRSLEQRAEIFDPRTWASELQAAHERIERHRQSDCVLVLHDAAGRPLKNTAVRIEQVRSSFPVGDQLWGLDALVRDGKAGSDRVRYQQKRFAELFNAANCLFYWTERERNDASKTEDFQGEPRLDNVAWQVDFANANGLIAKGHPVLWSIPKAWPGWLARYPVETQMKFAEVRTRSLLARFRGKIRMYDVVNEPMWEPVPANLPRRHWPHIEPIEHIADFCCQAIQWCREEDPDAQLLINDYGMEQDTGQRPLGSDGQPVTAARQRERYIALIAEMKRRGLAPDAVGLQSHTGGWLTPAQQLGIYQQFAQTGLPVHITEFWVHEQDVDPNAKLDPQERSALCAAYAAHYLTLAFSSPHVEAFFFWGAKVLHWRDALSGHELTPTWHALNELLNVKWKTRLLATTDAHGTVRFRGFHGGYRLLYGLDAPVQPAESFQLDPAQSGPVKLSLRHANAR